MNIFTKNISIENIFKQVVFNSKLKQTYFKNHSNSKYSLELIIDELLYFLKSGVSWRMLRSPIKWQTLQWHYSRFVKQNIFGRIFNHIKNKYLKKLINHKQSQTMFIDATVVNNKFGVNKIGRNKFYKNKKATKISLMTDSKGFPLSIFFMKGNYHDTRVFGKHIRDAIVIIPNKKKIIADKGYSSKKNYNLLNSNNIEHIIPPRRNMIIKNSYKYDKEEYIKRIKVEHIFGRLKMFRRLSLRYDKLLRNFSGFVYLAFSIISINIIKSI